MALLSFQEFLQTKSKEKLFIADTSFLLNSVVRGTEEYDFRKKIAGHIGLAYNVIIRKEIMHITRYQLFKTVFESGDLKMRQSLKNLWDLKQDHDRLKEICKGGYAEIFREIFGNNGERLEEEVNRILVGCIYVDGKKNKNSSNWNQVYTLMATYGLDSSDAMIVNFAAGDASYAGIITSDADYRVCADVSSKNTFDILVPKSIRHIVPCKDWRAPKEI